MEKRHLILRLRLAALLCMVTLFAGAQELKVENFTETMEVMSSRIQVNDLNGEVCALVTVQLPVEGCVFEGGIVRQEFHVNQYYVYMPRGERYLKILCPGRQTLDIDMGDYVGSGLKGNKIYNLVLSGYPASTDELREANRHYGREVSIGTTPVSTYDEAYKLYVRGSQLVDEEEYKKALDVLFVAASYKGNSEFSSYVYDNIALCYKGLGDTQNAVDYENEAIAENSNNPVARYNLGVIHYDAGNKDKAQRAFAQFIHLFEGSDNKVSKEMMHAAYAYKGDIHKEYGEYKQAESAYLKSLAYEPNSAAYLGLADIYLELDNFAKAIENYEKGIAYEPHRLSNIKRYLQLGYAYMGDKQYDKARGAFSNCSNCFKMYIDVFKYWVEDGDIEDFAYVYEVTAHCANAMLWVARLSDQSDAELKIAGYEGGMSMFSNLSLEAQIMPRDFLDLAMTYYRIGNKEKGDTTLMNAYEKYPDDVDVMYGYSFLLQEDSPDRVALLKKIIDKEKTANPIGFDYGTVYNNLAWSYRLQGEYMTGLPYAEKAVALNPEHDYSWETIGEIYYLVGRYDDCIDAMTKCLSIDNCDSQKSALEYRGQAYINIGETEKGNRDLEEAKKYEK